MSKKNAIIQTSIFLIFIFAFFILNLLLPDREFSERENRYLAQIPDFSLNELFFGKFTSNFESYTTDQFAFRDAWTTLKARSELTIGKKENNGVYLCDGDVLIERYESPDMEKMDTNIDAINKLVQNVDIPVYFALIPGAADIWSHKLPNNAPNDSQKELVDMVYSQVSANTVDVWSVLNEHRDEYIYYRTDHHWTSLGAYYGYTALMTAMGLDYNHLSSYSPRTVTESFYGTVYSTSGISWVKPDSIDIFVESYEDLEIINYPSGSPVDGTLYNESFLDKKDKYAMFLGGNTPLLQIDTGNDDAPSLLIVRDSYIDSQIPFILDSFSEIHIIDLRYYKPSLKNYIDENAIDNVLVCYSVNNFSTDSYIFQLGY